MERISLDRLKKLATDVNAINETPEDYEDSFHVSAYVDDFSGKRYYKVTIYNGESVVMDSLTARECDVFLQGMVFMAGHKTF